jgi:glycosyltransferase involved in cell wall biosynthesis
MTMQEFYLCIELTEDERWKGGSIYIENLIKTLLSLPRSQRPIIEVCVLSNTESQFVRRLKNLPIHFASHTSHSFVPRIIQRLSQRLPSGFHTLKAKLRMRRQENKPHLWFPAFECSSIPRPELYWIPDFQHFYLPQFFSKDEIVIRNATQMKIANQSGLLLLSSQQALEDFNAHYPCSLVKPRVWSFCSHVDTSKETNVRPVLKKYDLPERFFYIPNQFWVHKDHITAFKSVALLRKEGIKVPIVCTGFESDYRNPGYFQELKSFLASEQLSAQVRLLGVIPRKDQIIIFRAATAIIQPSLFEGWSTVIEDTKAIGRPIIASDIKVHYEQLAEFNGHKWFFPKSNVAALAEILAVAWSKLRKGPELEIERTASKEASYRQLKSAREFMRIAWEAAQYY